MHPIEDLGLLNGCGLLVVLLVLFVMLLVFIIVVVVHLLIVFVILLLMTTLIWILLLLLLIILERILATTPLEEDLLNILLDLHGKEIGQLRVERMLEGKQAGKLIGIITIVDLDVFLLPSTNVDGNREELIRL